MSYINNNNRMKKCLTVIVFAFLLLISGVFTTSNVTAATWKTIPNSVGLPSGSVLPLNFAKATVTWNSAYDHKTLSLSEDGEAMGKAYCIKLRNGTSKASTYTNPFTITWKNASSIGGRSINVTMKVTSLTIGKANSTKNLRSDQMVCFFRNLHNSVQLHNSSSSAHPVGLYRAPRTMKITTTITWADTGKVVQLPFYQGVKDIDAGYGSGYYKEAWEGTSGYSTPWYRWNVKKYEYSVSGNKLIDAATTLADTNTEMWKNAGAIAPTNNGTFTSTYWGGNCGTGVYLYNQYRDISADKTVDKSTVSPGDTVTWTAKQKVGTFYKDTFAFYTSFTLTDKLPDGVEYVSAKAYDNKGNSLASKGTLSYNASTRTVTFKLNDATLKDQSFYDGKQVCVDIVTKVTTNNAKIINTLEDSVSSQIYKAEKPITAAAQLSIAKTVNRPTFKNGDDMTYTVEVKQTKSGRTARDVVISDTLPSGLTLSGTPTISGVEGTVSVNGNAWSAEVSELAYGKTAKVTFKAIADTEEDTITNTATAKAYQIDEVDSSATIEKIPDAVTSVQVAKNWDDDNNGDGVRPASVTVHLLQNGKEYASTVLSPANNWKHTFENLPKYDNTIEDRYTPERYRGELETFTYTVKEDDVEYYADSETLTAATSKNEGYRITYKTGLAGGDYGDAYIIYYEKDGSWYSTGWIEFGDEISNGLTTGTMEIPSKNFLLYFYPEYFDSDTIFFEPGFIVTSCEEYTPPDSAYSGKALTAKDVRRTLEQQSGIGHSGHKLFTTVNDPSDINIENYENNIDFSVRCIGENTVLTPQIWTITNTQEELTSLTAKKVWNAPNDVDVTDGARPNNITVQLLQDGEVYAEKALSSSNNWQYTFEKLPKYKDDGTEHTYTVKENSVPDGYTVEYSNSGTTTTITNTYIGVTSVSGQKNWEDSDNAYKTRPESVTINLLRNGVKVDAQKVTDNDGWSYSFDNLPRYSEDGKAYTYTVEEESVEGYTTSYQTIESEDETTESETPIRVTFTSDSQLDSDYDSATIYYVKDGKLHGVNGFNFIGKILDDPWDPGTYVVDLPTSEFYLEVNTEDSYSGASQLCWTRVIQVESVTALEPGSVTESAGSGLSTLPSYWPTDIIEASNASDINTTIKSQFNGASKTTVWHYKGTENAREYTTSINITNTLIVEDTVSVQGTKTWNDNNNANGNRPDSVEISLLADDEVVEVKTITAAENWSYQFDGLPAGHEYSVIESIIPGGYVPSYTRTESGDVTICNITNTEVETVDIQGTKIWDDNNDEAGNRPENITVYLLEDGEIIDDTTVTAEDNWAFQFTALPKYKEGTEPYVYTILEEEVPGYSDSYEKTASRDGTVYTITNTYEGEPEPEYITVQGKKLWNDKNGADGTRPESVTVNLLQDGEIIAEMDITAEDNWEYEFPLLPEYRTETEKYVYRVSERVPSGYTASYQTEEVDGVTWYNIINTPVTEKEVTITKEIDKTDDYAAHGEATFLFKITDADNADHVWYQSIAFTDADITATAADTVKKSITLSLARGTYTVEETDVLRYDGDVTDTEGNAERVGKGIAKVTVDGTEAIPSVTFKNVKTRWDQYTHNNLIINQFH